METLTTQSPQVIDAEDGPVAVITQDDEPDEELLSSAALQSSLDGDGLDEQEFLELHREIEQFLMAQGALGAEQVAQEKEFKQRLKNLQARFSKTVAVRAAIEVIGLGVDAALMGAGSAGVGLMKAVTYREIVATAPEILALEKIKHRLNSEHQDRGHERIRDRIKNLNKKVLRQKVAAELENARKELSVKKVLTRMGSVAVGVSVAVVAQKAGVGLVEHVHDSLNHGAGHIAVPLTSKLGALGGANAASKSIGRYFRR